MGHSAFVSYCSVDKEAALLVCRALEASNIPCWIAPRNITPGEDWGAEVVKAIDQSHIMILVFSGRCNDSLHVKNELLRAVNGNVPILPFRIENTKPGEARQAFRCPDCFTDWLGLLFSQWWA